MFLNDIHTPASAMAENLVGLIVIILKQHSIVTEMVFRMEC